MATTLPILTYHSLDESGSVVSTSPRVFLEQMRQLGKSGFRTVSLSAAVEAIKSGKAFPEKTFAVTFDDGYESVFHHGFPVLQEYGFEATIFVISGYCGKTNAWPGHKAPIPDEPLASLEQLGRMAEGGMSMGAHTVTHPDLTQLRTSDIEDEVLKSREAIRDTMGVTVDTFAYPYGCYDSRVRQIVANHFSGACSVKLGKARLDSDRYLLPRIDACYLSNPVVFRAFSMGLADGYLALRNLLRSARTCVAKRA